MGLRKSLKKAICDHKVLAVVSVVAALAFGIVMKSVSAAMVAFGLIILIAALGRMWKKVAGDEHCKGYRFTFGAAIFFATMLIISMLSSIWDMYDLPGSKLMASLAYYGVHLSLVLAFLGLVLLAVYAIKKGCSKTEEA